MERKNPMAEPPRCTSRSVKPKYDKDFVYDDDVVQSIVGSNSEVWQPQPFSEHSDSSISTSDQLEDNSEVQGRATWSDLHNLPSYLGTDRESDCNSSVFSVSEENLNRSQVANQNTQHSSEDVSAQFSSEVVNTVC